MLFNEEISDWESWGNIYQNDVAFTPLIHAIFEQNSLPITHIEHTQPGTNAVFKVGAYIIKIYAPESSGLTTIADYEMETFGLEKARDLSINVPDLVAKGVISDTYDFYYIIIKYITAPSFSTVQSRYEKSEKQLFGKALCEITDRLNVFDSSLSEVILFDCMYDASRWDGFPQAFQDEVMTYVSTIPIDDVVYTHGDLNPDNILIDEQSKIYLIDFADSLLAPRIYEHALIISELFKFDKDYLQGYFGEYDIECLALTCLNGLLIHDFGHEIIKDNICDVASVTSIERLYSKIVEKLSQ